MMLFRVRDTDVYLSDTLHVLPEGAPMPPAIVWEVHKKSSLVIFESDFDRTVPPPAWAFLDAGRSLQSLVPINLYLPTAAAWESAGIKITLADVKPWFAALLLGYALSTKNGLKRELGVDLQFWKATPAPRRAILEGEEALLAFDRAPMSEQIAGLSMVVKTPEIVSARQLRLCEYWKASDADGFANELIAVREISPTVMAGLIDQRNRQWAPSILKSVVGKVPTLVLVGALHLVGPHSLQALIEAAGFKVDRVR